MRTELVNGRWLLCGCILPIEHIKHEQTWAAASGSEHTVQISAVRDGWVCYSWREKGQVRYHEKDSFAFQCRYCLVLPTADIPEELL